MNLIVRSTPLKRLLCRFLYVIQYYVGNGFYVLIDYHAGLGLIEVDRRIVSNQTIFAQNWLSLLDALRSLPSYAEQLQGDWYVSRQWNTALQHYTPNKYLGESLKIAALYALREKWNQLLYHYYITTSWEEHWLRLQVLHVSLQSLQGLTARCLKCKPLTHKHKWPLPYPRECKLQVCRSCTVWHLERTRCFWLIVEPPSTHIYRPGSWHYFSAILGSTLHHHRFSISRAWLRSPVPLSGHRAIWTTRHQLG